MNQSRIQDFEIERGANDEQGTSRVDCTEFLYAVKAQTSLAPLSRFRGSLITTAHAHQCCRFQSYAETHAIAY